MSAVAESRERRDLLYTLKYIGVGTGGGGQGGLCPSKILERVGRDLARDVHIMPA